MTEQSVAQSPPALSLDSLTLTDADPRDLIRAAGAAGFDRVSLWLQPPAIFARHLVTAELADECGDLLAETGVGVHTIEALDLSSAEAVRAAEPMLALGSRLGARALVVMHNANPDRAEAAQLLRLIAQMAADHGLGINLEPVAMGQTRTLGQARDLIGDAGVDAGIVFDALHFVRNGAALSTITEIEPGLIRYVQICDGPAEMERKQWGMEACFSRLHPGEGAFPLADLARVLPRDVPWAVEIPRLKWTEAGVPPRVQAQVAMEGLRAVLDSGAPSSVG